MVKVLLFATGLVIGHFLPRGAVISMAGVVFGVVFAVVCRAVVCHMQGWLQRRRLRSETGRMVHKMGPGL